MLVEHQNASADKESASTCEPATPNTKSLRLQDHLQEIDMQINRDTDEDGFSISNGDCDNQVPLTYPGAYELQDKMITTQQFCINLSIHRHDCVTVDALN